MGESAGAGSIVHHITAFGGKQPLLFNRAVMQSPAYNVHSWDRRGDNEDTFKKFLADAGCIDKGIQCLRTIPFPKLKFAQDEVIKKAVEGTFGFGPSADGKWVRQLPQLELLSGNFVKTLDSLIVTHVTDESNIFTRRDRVYNDAKFKKMLDWHYGNNSAATNALLKHFPLDKYQDGRSRHMDYQMHVTFSCTTRLIAQAYPNSTYMAQYEGNHGMDLTANFYDPSSTSAKVSSFLSGSNSNEKYQLYLASYAQSGSPNKFKAPDTPDWDKIIFGDVIGNVLEVTTRFKLIKDFQTSASDCDIITNAMSAATADAGM
jgi:carboxylesterase type B